MKIFYDLNFFVKLAAAFLVMLAAWLVPGWKYGVPLAFITVAFLVLVKGAGLAWLSQRCRASDTACHGELDSQSRASRRCVC